MNIEREKTYKGSIIKYFHEREFGFIRTKAFGDIFFHSHRFVAPPRSIEVGDLVSFRLSYSRKHPGKIAATHLKPIQPDYSKLIERLGFIDSEDKFNALCIILNKEAKLENSRIIAALAYEKCSPLWKLKLWLRKYVDVFDFDLFRKYEFRLYRQEAIQFRRYVKQYLSAEKINMLRGLLAPSKLIETLEDGRKIYEASWRDIGFDDKKIFFNIGTSKDSVLVDADWSFAKADFNLVVNSYISRKDLKSIRFTVFAGIVEAIEELDQLELAIIIVEKNRMKSKVGILKEGYTPKQIREQPEFVTLTNVDLLKIFGNHECIDFLQQLQTTNAKMPLLYISEKRFIPTTGYPTFENSYLFTIILGNNKIAIVWESVKLNRATQVFICGYDQYFEQIEKIDEFLASIDYSKKRSSLKAANEDGEELRNQLGYTCSVEHTNYSFQKWLNNLKRAIPEIEHVIMEMQIEFPEYTISSFEKIGTNLMNSTQQSSI